MRAMRGSVKRVLKASSSSGSRGRAEQMLTITCSSRCECGLHDATIISSMSPSSEPVSMVSMAGLSVAIASMTSSALLPQRR